MPKKKNPFEEVEGEVVKLAGDFVSGKIQRRLLRLGEQSLLMLIAAILLSIGIAELIGYFYPAMNNGSNYLLLGVIFLVLAVVLK